MIELALVAAVIVAAVYFRALLGEAFALALLVQLVTLI
jgi:hypothetical protein